MLLGPADLEGFKILIRSLTSNKVTGLRKGELPLLLDKYSKGDFGVWKKDLSCQLRSWQTSCFLIDKQALKRNERCDARNENTLLTSIKTSSDFANADLANLILSVATAIFMNFFRFSSLRSNKFESQFGVVVGIERLFLVELLLEC